MSEYSKNRSIKFWAVEDRPREKLLSLGLSSLSDTELVAIIIGSGSRKESAVEVARTILNSINNNIDTLATLSVAQLKRYNGIGTVKAISVVAAFELGRRRRYKVSSKMKITSSRDVADIMHPLISELNREEVWVLYLNRANRVVRKSRVSQGGISGTVIDIRLIIKEALELCSSSIIICHNHPSGALKPSEADIQITNRLKSAGELMDIKLLDHLIVSMNRHYSFADDNML